MPESSRRRLALAAACLTCAVGASAAEGMWTFDNLPRRLMQERYGFSPTRAWADHVQRSAVLIAGSCSGAFVSAKGLVMTDHHCVRDCIEQLSSADRDYIGQGFYAAKQAEEKACPEIELDRLDVISDVTARLKTITRGLSGRAFSHALQAEQSEIESECVGADSKATRCDVVELYHGARYHLYKYHRYQDVRLVFAPEAAVASFGGDPDNFSFPRYDLDVGLLRAYENGRPARVKDYLYFSQHGAAAGELTLVVGHPASTQRSDTLSQLATLRDDILVQRIALLAELRGVITRYAQESVEHRRTVRELIADIETGLKAFKGELQSLADPAVFGRKQQQESDLRRFAAADPRLSAETAAAFDDVAQAEGVRRDNYQPNRLLERGSGFDARYFDFARIIVRGTAEREKPNAERLREFTESALPVQEQNLFSTAPIHPELEQVKLAFSLTKLRELLGADDALVHQLFAVDSPDTLAANLVKNTRLGDLAVRKALWEGGSAAVAASDDPFIRLAIAVDPAARAVRKTVEDGVDAMENKSAETIAAAMFAKTGTSVYPDATFTLRLSYGEVKGWEEHARSIAPFTDIDGIYRRNTGYDPFMLPERWLSARTHLDGGRHFNFTTTNDVTGGDSGSPVIDRNGAIVGLLFDGNRHALGNAYGFDERASRAVAVDSGALIETLSKVYNAKRVVDELKFAVP